jgi:hypothetical protein
VQAGTDAAKLGEEADHLLLAAAISVGQERCGRVLDALFVVCLLTGGVAEWQCVGESRRVLNTRRC